MKRPDLKNWAPPGMPIRRLRRLFLAGEGVAFLMSTGFLTSYCFFLGSCRKAVEQGETAVMPLFSDLFAGRHYLRGFLILALCSLVLIPMFYFSYRQGSMSIYLMRRLPDRWLIHRQCWSLPLLFATLAGLTALAVLGLYYVIYLLCTPAACLPV